MTVSLKRLIPVDGFVGDGAIKEGKEFHRSQGGTDSERRKLK